MNNAGGDFRKMDINKFLGNLHKAVESSPPNGDVSPRADNKWPAGQLRLTTRLIEMAYLPERINRNEIWQTLVEGPEKLDWYWRAVLLGNIEYIINPDGHVEIKGNDR